jgi:hypothetical protein
MNPAQATRGCPPGNQKIRTDLSGAWRHLLAFWAETFVSQCMGGLAPSGKLGTSPPRTWADRWRRGDAWTLHNTNPLPFCRRRNRCQTVRIPDAFVHALPSFHDQLGRHGAMYAHCYVSMYSIAGDRRRDTRGNHNPTIPLPVCVCVCIHVFCPPRGFEILAIPRLRPCRSCPPRSVSAPGHEQMAWVYRLDLERCPARLGVPGN